MATMLGSLLVSLGLESGQFKSGLDASQKKFRSSTGRMQRDAESAARGISNQMRTLSLSLGAFFSGRELVGLLDGFTRLRNNLRVAGVEGENLKGVQDRLFASAQRYGVSVEELSSLFGKASQSQRELGSTQEQLLAITNAAAAALKITGTSSQAASGALLGLTQAFSSGTVKAEEYNQMIEGGLQPLLQVVANSDKFGGSLGKLRAAVVDGKLSSKEFFDLLLQGSKTLEGTAAKSVMTLTGGFTTLTNALTIYFGEADQANGVSAALGGTLAAVGRNLQTIIPIIATVGGVLAARFVANLIAARVAALALTATTAGLTTATATMGLVAGTAGRAILAAFGGPIGLAIAAIGTAIYFVATKSEEATKATGAYAKAQAIAAEASKTSASMAERLATAHGKARAEALAAAKAEAENVKQKLASAKASLVLANAELTRLKIRNAADVKVGAASTVGAGGGIDRLAVSTSRNTPGLLQAEANAKAAQATTDALGKSLATIEKAIKAAAAPTVSSVPAVSKDKKGGGSSGPSAAEISERYNSELAGYASQSISAMADLATSTEERADLELRNVELARVRTLSDINNDKDYSAFQKKRLVDQVEVLAELDRQRIERDKNRQLEQEAQDIAAEQFRLEQDALQFQYDFADNQTDRRQIALEMLALEHRYQASLLEAVIASEAATDAEKKRAQVALDGLNKAAGAKAEAVGRANESPGQAYARDLMKTPAAMNEAIEGIKVSGLQALNDQLVDAIVNFKSLADVARSVVQQVLSELMRLAIQQAIIKPLAGALGIPGFASGTNFAPGGMAIVGERGPELVNLPRGSQVVPNHELRGFGGSSEVHQPTFVFPGITNARDAREAAGQAARRYRRELNPMKAA